MSSRSRWVALLGSCAVLALACVIAVGQPPAKPPAEPKGGKGGESERKVEEKDVPKAALDVLKKLAGDAKITEFAEEIEHGSTFYEGSWKGPNGHVDVLVTANGDLVEIEEAVAGDAVPKTVKAAAEKLAGKDAQMRFEKKTMVLYEVKFKKDNKFHEVLLTPDGRHEKEEAEEEGDEEEDD